LAITINAHAATRVWGFYGWGDNVFGSSSGVDDIAATARHIPHVASVHVLNYWETQRAADEISATPRGDRIVLYGYSCGGNAVTTIAYAFNGHRHIDLAAIQPSIWCGGHQITPNVPYAQQTYAGCIITLGLGCRRWHPVPGNHVSDIVRIRRPSLHSRADNDPAAQRDVLSVIARQPPLRAQDIEIVRY
jgi:hypothetical protein